MADILELGSANGLALGPSLMGGQSFRWQEAAPGVWRGAAGAYAAEVWVEDGLLYARPLGPTGAGAGEFWRHYFALDIDYPALQQRFGGSKRLGACVAACPGIRVLRQPFFEALCCFIISQNNNIPRITGIVARLCALCGQLLVAGAPGAAPAAGAGALYAFPTPQALAAQTPESLAPL
ncbi:MAG: DNA glycosylase, partial [Gemmiger sp.]|nr:DNA glycosylase [Gemmiger sp.]